MNLLPGSENPEVRPARWYEWTGWWSLLLEVLLWGQDELGAWESPPRWVAVALAAVPWIIRYVRQRLTGVASSYRRAA